MLLCWTCCDPTAVDVALDSALALSYGIVGLVHQKDAPPPKQKQFQSTWLVGQSQWIVITAPKTYMWTLCPRKANVASRSDTCETISDKLLHDRQLHEHTHICMWAIGPSTQQLVWNCFIGLRLWNNIGLAWTQCSQLSVWAVITIHCDCPTSQVVWNCFGGGASLWCTSPTILYDNARS